MVDGADNLRLGSNGAVPTVRVHDTLLRSLAEVKDTSLAVRQVMTEINALKTQNIPISTRDVRKWQRRNAVVYFFWCRVCVWYSG